jgi:hypothetical protein
LNGNLGGITKKGLVKDEENVGYVSASMVSNSYGKISDDG